MKITLLNCPMWATREPPIRVAQVAGVLRSKGFDTHCFDINNYLYKNRSDENKNLWAWEQVVFWGRQENIKEYFNENKEQLDFITETGKYFERVYPSRSYCAIEQFSMLHEHPEKFGIKTPFNHHLYWETVDGKNTYPVRLNRCKRFEQKCHELGVRVDVGVQTNVDMAEFFNLGLYYEYIKDYEKAKYYLNKYLQLDPNNEYINKKMEEIKEKS